MTNQQLVVVPILALANDPLTLRPQQTKVHPKQLKRLKMLRLARPLTEELASNLSFFSGLNQLYLDGGIDSLEVLSAIGRAWSSKNKLQVIFGYSVNSPQPLFEQLPSIRSVMFEISASQTSQLSDAVYLELFLNPSDVLSQSFASWPNLKQLEIRLEDGAKMVDFQSPPSLSILTADFVGFCSMRTDTESPLAVMKLSAKFDSSLFSPNKIKLEGDVACFTHLQINYTGTSDIVALLNQLSSLKIVQLNFSDHFSRSEIEQTVLKLATNQRQVTAYQSSDPQFIESFDSVTKRWDVSSFR